MFPAAIEADLVIAADGDRKWAVISKNCTFRKGLAGRVAVIHGGLESQEAAEFALQDAADNLASDGSPYGRQRVEREYFETRGRVLARLRQEGVEAENLLALAISLCGAFRGMPMGSDDEIPF